MNIIKHSKDQEKRLLILPDKNENFTFQKIRKYPRRLYLKKKAGTVLSNEKEEINSNDAVENDNENENDKEKKSSNNGFNEAKLKKTSQSIQNLRSIHVT